ncbi:hypothetical protein KIN20_000448 [Parelaphostrongylus tenuis]|uniref:Uncharacterized protein n=1 Tax=Parelaphostrongylus tenuis TaxID=148309 RepID=A0AAD5LW49_PARTN|nr:hypothetical protein KIN20_000448 [Parelaphostrongylus tenuis]
MNLHNVQNPLWNSCPRKHRSAVVNVIKCYTAEWTVTKEASNLCRECHNHRPVLT